MKVRKLAVALALAGGLGSGMAHALGMGEGRILTNLNEPLRAEIELSRVGDVPQEQIRVSLASEDDFDRAGINKMHFLRQLDFELIRSDDGQLMIEVTSDSPVREPFLNLLVDVTWPSGRVLRQYAFLVDPPERPDEEEAVGPEAEPTDTAAPEEPDFDVEPALEEEPEGEVYGPTASNDRLWNIAGEHSPAADLTRQQVMLAIQDLNPDAFVEGNINRLRQGHVLRLPSEEQARSRSTAAAVQEVRVQNEAFETTPAPEEAVVDATEDEAEEDVAADAAPAGVADADDDELRIVAAEDGMDGEALTGNGNGNGDGQLSAALEELDRVERDREEMSERVEELEEQVGTMEELLQLKDDQLAEMQQRMEEIEEREAELAEREARPEEDEEDAADVAAAPDPDEPAPDEAPAEPDPAADEDPMPTTVGGFVERMANDVRYQIGAGALAIALLALLWALARRSAAREEAFYDQIQGASEGEEDDDDVLDFDDESLAEEEGAESAGVAGDVDQPRDDALAEADMYMAYGRTDQAAQHLEDAISREPSRADLRVKLLEAYSQAGDSESFEKQYGELTALGDEEAKQQADELRANISGDSDLSIDDLADELKTSLGEDEDDDDAVGGAFGEDTAQKAGGEESGQEANEEADSGLDWDLDLDAAADLTDTSDAPAGEEPESGEGSEEGTEDFSDLGFSLDDLELEDDSPADGGAEEATGDDELSEDDLASLDLGEDDWGQSGDQQTEEPVLDLEGLDESEPESPSTDESGEDSGEAIEFEMPELDSEDTSEQSVPGVSDTESTEQTEADTAGEPAGAEEPAAEEPASPSAEATASATEASGFDESFLDELDAELEKVAGEEQEAAESPDDLDSDVSDEDLTLMDEGTDESEESGAISEEESLALQGDDSSADEAGSQTGQQAEPDSDFSELEDTDLDDSILEQAEASVAGDSEDAAEDSEASSDDDEFDFLEGTDEAGTKLDLARAYVEMGDADGARDILEEVAREGSDQQKEDAQRLLKEL